jgi:ribosomal protein L12E/L44/L45/RPP1/RPP2
MAAGDGVEISLLPMPGVEAAAAPAAAAGAGSAVSADGAELRKNPGGYLERMSREIARAPLPDPARLPALKPLPALSGGGEIELPVLVGQASYGWVRGWVRERAALPPANAVRLEELVNAFPLPVAVERGIASSIQSAACPWNPSTFLVAATLVAPAGSETPVKWSFEAAEGARIRLIASPGSGARPLPDRLPGARPVTVLIEVAPAAGGERLGVLKLDAAGEFSGRIVERPDAAASPAMRQLGLVAAFGLWLRGEEVSASTLEAVLAGAGVDEDPGRADTRRLVREALDLAAPRR